MDMMDEDKVARLFKLKSMIQENIMWLDIRPYSHNLISLELRIIDEEFGQEYANKIILDYGLDKMGWCIEN
jgi:gamma-glutamyl:cysteine ligase YbdK (ATP-grasp superfamily)